MSAQHFTEDDRFDLYHKHSIDSTLSTSSRNENDKGWEWGIKVKRKVTENSRNGPGHRVLGSLINVTLRTFGTK